MCTQEANSHHGIVESARLPIVHTRCPTLNTGKEVQQDFRICTQEVQLSTRDRLPNVHKRCPTLNLGKAVWQDFRMCTQEVQLPTRDRKFGKTSECAHKMSNSSHGKGNLARLPNMHTRGATLNTGKVRRQDFRMCTQEVQLSIGYRQLGKTSKCTHKRSNSQHGIGS
ncbi:hypothetical protein PoB_003929500 [Plakobranchus ocellatus]|uniref:Uncharacterized protein n=1 Tax=Plakobranchus ocellatus TaxID=259542 RepID=A0AAV4AWN8_9GAST|nr:hypothetical protein PoB_003929500 [Plakobranchus ocellatus]